MNSGSSVGLSGMSVSDALGHLLSAGTGNPEAQLGPFVALKSSFLGLSPVVVARRSAKCVFFSMKIHPQLGAGGAELKAWGRELEKLRFDV